MDDPTVIEVNFPLDGKELTNRQILEFFLQTTGKQICDSEEIIAAFRLGINYRKQLGYKRRSALKKRTPREQAVEYRIRMLNPGEKIFLPIDRHGAARAAASKLKKNFGVILFVSKESDAEISVTRRK